MPGSVANLAARVGALLTKGGLWMGVAISAGLAVGSIVLVVIVVINWRADHFKHWPPGTAPPAVPRTPAGCGRQRRRPASCWCCWGW